MTTDPHGGLVVDRRRGRWIIAALSLLTIAAISPSLAQDASPFKPIADGVFARPLFEARTETASFEVEVWHLLIAAGRVGDSSIALPGGAVLEFLSGRGTIRVGDREREVGPGAVVAVDERTPVIFSLSEGDGPLECRATLIRGEVQ